jgi:hypothetical protein
MMAESRREEVKDTRMPTLDDALARQRSRGHVTPNDEAHLAQPTTASGDDSEEAAKPAAYPIKLAGKHLRCFGEDDVRDAVELIVVTLRPRDWIDIQPVWYPVKWR